MSNMNEFILRSINFFVLEKIIRLLSIKYSFNTALRALQIHHCQYAFYEVLSSNFGNSYNQWVQNFNWMIVNWDLIALQLTVILLPFFLFRGARHLRFPRKSLKGIILS